MNKESQMGSVLSFGFDFTVLLVVVTVFYYKNCLVSLSVPRGGDGFRFRFFQ